MNPANWTWQIWFNVFVKVSLIGLLLFAVLNPDMQQFEGKAMTGRALTYPMALLVVPVIWFVLHRSRPQLAYPHVLDALLGMPFLIDTAGNALDLYDTIEWWDDFNHFLNWAILTFAVAIFLVNVGQRGWVLFGLAVGIGAVAGIIWEIAEYFTFVRDSPEMATAYTDTLGDLALDSSGAAVAALVMVLAMRRADRSRSQDVVDSADSSDSFGHQRSAH